MCCETNRYKKYFMELVISNDEGIDLLINLFGGGSCATRLTCAEHVCQRLRDALP
jgi:hypothetical protein